MSLNGRTAHCFLSFLQMIGRGAFSETSCFLVRRRDHTQVSLALEASALATEILYSPTYPHYTHTLIFYSNALYDIKAFSADTCNSGFLARLDNVQEKLLYYPRRGH